MEGPQGRKKQRNEQVIRRVELRKIMKVTEEREKEELW